MLMARFTGDKQMIFNWHHYLHEQLQWAECLISQAQECEGKEKQEFYKLGKSALHNATQRLDIISDSEQRQI